VSDAPKSPLRAYGRFGTVGLELVLSIVLGYAFGHWLDGRYFPGHFYLTIVFTLAGTYAGFRAMFKAAKAAEREAERLDEAEAEARREAVAEAGRKAKLTKLLAPEAPALPGDGDVADEPVHDGGDEALERALAALERSQRAKKANARASQEAAERARALGAAHPPDARRPPASEEERVRARLEAALSDDDEASP
jgi:F0F1-type ATP synthase assembly protein I